MKYNLVSENPLSGIHGGASRGVESGAVLDHPRSLIIQLLRPEQESSIASGPQRARDTARCEQNIEVLRLDAGLSAVRWTVLWGVDSTPMPGTESYVVPAPVGENTTGLLPSNQELVREGVRSRNRDTA
ncbi:MAG: hypothetical protein HY650_12350 [Acidobacteria bacterium]|nr:hypothetical protein [Acidobacteriota bacterium]